MIHLAGGGFGGPLNKLAEPTLGNAISMGVGDMVHEFEITNFFDIAGGAADIHTLLVANTANTTQLSLRLWFFGDDPDADSAEGAAFDLSDTNRQALVGMATVRTGSGAGHTQGVVMRTTDRIIPLQNKESTPGRSLWVVTEALDDFTSVTDMLEYTFVGKNI